MKWRAVTAAVVFIGMCAGAVRGEEGLSPQVLKDIKAATVFIKLKVNSIAVSSGSGFVIRHEEDATLIATNDHVVRMPELFDTAPILGSGKQEVSVVVVFNSGGQNEQTLPAAILAQNPAQDLAILRVKGATSKPRPIDFEHPPKLHETMTVFAFGFPFGSLLAANERNPAITVTRAAVSSIRQDEQAEDALIQIDGSLNPGNSGGPIVDSKGNLIAVSVKSILGSGIGFGIPSPRVDRTMRGDIAAIAFRARRLGEDKAAVDVRVQLADPLKRIKSTSINYIPGPAKSGTTDAGQPRVPLEGCETLVLKREGQFAVGQFEVPVKAGASLQLVVQPTFIDESDTITVLAAHAIEDDFANSDRKAFAYASIDGKIKGRFVWSSAGWLDTFENRTNSKKPTRSSARYTEVHRTDAYVELRTTKGQLVRLYPDHISVCQTSGQWATSHQGSWTRATIDELRLAAQPPVVKPRIAARRPAAPVVTARPPQPPAVAPGDPSRSIWKYTAADRKRTGSFTKTSEGWLEEYEEQRESGARRLKFKYRETQRTEEYIEMADNRANNVRLYDDRAESRSGPGEWERLYAGSWEGRTAPMPPVAVAAGDRRVWRFVNQKNKTGAFTRTETGWVEDNTSKAAGGKSEMEHHEFRTVAENDDYIEMIDDRKIAVRLYPDRAEAKLLDRPWFRLYAGRWDAPVAVAKSETPAPDEAPPEPDDPTATAEPAAPAAADRTVWKYENQKNASGTFRRTDDGWIEEKETTVGKTTRVETITYRETATTDNYIEMIDEKRDITNRIYANHTEWRFGNGRWNREFQGAWISEK